MIYCSNNYVSLLYNAPNKNMVKLQKKSPKRHNFQESYDRHDMTDSFPIEKKRTTVAKTALRSIRRSKIKEFLPSGPCNNKQILEHI